MYRRNNPAIELVAAAGCSRNDFRYDFSTVPKDGAILVPLATARPQTCLEFREQLHGVFVNAGARNPWTYCGETLYYSDRSLHHYKFGPPTCKACLVHKSVWCSYLVLPYEPKRDIERRIRKERTAVEKHLRLPTAYARILDDDLFENPTYKPVKYQPPSPDEDDPTMDFDDDPRERKRASAIDSNRRLEDVRARVQGHRR